MDCTSTGLSFRDTHAFTPIALDYLDQAAALRPFFGHTPDQAGIAAAMEARSAFPTDREKLVSVLRTQYKRVTAQTAVQENIEALLSEDCFTITTAHQNNLFTGPLYFIYKILHVAKLAAELQGLHPGNRFVPVFYMGSEDADLAELNHIRLNGENLVWSPDQLGAVGRMEIDASLVSLIDRIAGQLNVWPNGEQAVRELRDCYQSGIPLQEATFRFVHQLLGSYGIIVLIADQADLKRSMLDVFTDDLLHQTASGIVGRTAGELARHYKVQAHPREINLFYLDHQVRERIQKEEDEWTVMRIGKKFDQQSLLAELTQHPERFSPNVILRGLYQETILPNILFVGGGGELAYWLELKEMFRHYGVPYPVLMLRNSLLLVEQPQQQLLNKLGFAIPDLFDSAQHLVNRLVRSETRQKLELKEQQQAIAGLYSEIRQVAGAIDQTLVGHVDALQVRTLRRLEQLENKMLRAERRKYTDQERQVHALKNRLFPGGGLQERTESFLYYYARWGNDFIRRLYQHSPGLNQQFIVLSFTE